MHGKVATRYAKGFLDSVGESKELATILEELSGFLSVFHGSKELEQVLTSVVFPVEKRVAVTRAICEKLGVNASVKHFMLLLTQRGRMVALPGIVDEIKTMQLQKAGGERISVKSASELSRDEKSSVEEKFAKVLGKKIEATYGTDAGLLGGIRVEAAGKTYDGSLAGWFGALEETLVGGTL